MAEWVDWAEGDDTTDWVGWIDGDDMAEWVDWPENGALADCRFRGLILSRAECQSPYYQSLSGFLNPPPPNPLTPPPQP